jgi:hypothetical protein
MSGWSAGRAINEAYPPHHIPASLFSSTSVCALTDHNGSLMSIEGSCGLRHHSLRGAETEPVGLGAAADTLLFEGAWQGPVLVVTAYVFGCGPPRP